MSALSRLGLRRYHIGVAIVGALLLALGWFIPRNHDWDPALWHMNWQQGFFSMLGFGSLFALCLAPALVIAGLAARSSLVFIFSSYSCLEMDSRFTSYLLDGSHSDHSD